MSEPRSTLILGGARSGKSRYAIEQALATGGRVAFIATAEALDAEMARRIAHHRRERPAHWVTVEAPTDLVGAVQDLTSRVDTLIIDCLTIWVANRCQRESADDALLADADALADLVKARRVTMLLVSNEVGQGVHPETELGLRFRDLLGVVNQRVAAAADQVVLMVAGLPVTAKGV
ncbi:MAG TPA: bifunctional adenosylcobinamide kinase/adenosylcobinamide-phosphate guanylyltransferase [Methylomirabilota bacterium]|nr:bifunctional adenosylcobinamide kinase/adenosylcobinamide-phosphate guanylyltransferase [Methylomirabilota bacterium]